MTTSRSNWRYAVAALLLVAVLTALVYFTHSSRVAPARIPPAPALFVVETPCPRSRKPREVAAKLELQGRFRADRYPYDPRDGPLAVRDYEMARACYRSTGDAPQANRADAAAQVLRSRVQTDYAASRLSLTRALESKRWATAGVEARRLIRLTEHLGERAYVEWLQSIVGRAAVGESQAP